MPVREPFSRCGALVIDSMPPATTTLAEPALIRSWPNMIAFMPEPQTLLMVVQPAEAGRPAFNAAWRAGAWPRPAGSTQPMITSSTWSAATPACSSAPVMTAEPRAGVGTPVNWPRKEPMAVRLAPTMTTSLMTDSNWTGRKSLPEPSDYAAACCTAANRGGKCAADHMPAVPGPRGAAPGSRDCGGPHLGLILIGTGPIAPIAADH